MNNIKLIAKVCLVGIVSVPVSAHLAAAADDVVNVYNWSDYIAEDTIAKFEQLTGIEVNYDLYDSNDILEAKLLAGNSGYDVVFPSSEYFARHAKAGIYAKLDRTKLNNFANLDEGLMSQAAKFDEDNQHSVIYMWGTTGIGYNVEQIKQRLGDTAPTSSWQLLFDPANAAKLQDCGIAILDAPYDVLPSAMIYLGINPHSYQEADYEKAQQLLKQIRPYVRYFNSLQMVSDLANGDVCLVLGWSGDILQAAYRAFEADNGVEVAYQIPTEGAMVWFDFAAIPLDAPNKNAAHKFIDFLMDAHIAAENTNYVAYANANKASIPFIDEEVLNNPGIYPSAETSKNLWGINILPSAKLDRFVNRLWTDLKTNT